PACLTYPAHGRSRLAVLLPEDAIAVLEGTARPRWLLRYPVGHDVVVGLVGDGDLHQLHAAAAPRPFALDPSRGPQIVAPLQIFVMAEPSLALHQAEPARVVQGERCHEQPLGIDERAPDPFGGAGLDGQAVGIVHLRSVVLSRGPLVGPER